MATRKKNSAEETESAPAKKTAKTKSASAAKKTVARKSSNSKSAPAKKIASAKASTKKAAPAKAPAKKSASAPAKSAAKPRKSAKKPKPEQLVLQSAAVEDPIGDVSDGEGHRWLGDEDKPLEKAEELPEEAEGGDWAETEAGGEAQAREPRGQRPEPHLERLQKILSQAGIASRRHAEEMIQAGRVMVNGQVVTQLGAKADPDRDHVRVDDKLIQRVERHRTFVLNKPRGYVTTVSDPEKRPTVMTFFERTRERLYPVGRLDYQSEGLLLMTNDGDLANLLTKAASGVEKTYVVKVAGQLTAEELDRLREGVSIEKGEQGSSRVRTAPAGIRQIRPGDNPWYEVVLIEGRNREIRKMFSATGHFVEKIRRVGYGPLVLDVEPGKFRELSAEELKALRLTAEGKMKPRRPKSSLLLPKEAGIPAEERAGFRKQQRRGDRRDDRPRPDFSAPKQDRPFAPRQDKPFAPRENRGFGSGRGERPPRPAFSRGPQSRGPQSFERLRQGDRGPRRDFSRGASRSGDRPGQRPNQRPEQRREFRPREERGARPETPTGFSGPRRESGLDIRPAGPQSRFDQRPGRTGPREQRFSPSGGDHERPRFGQGKRPRFDRPPRPAARTFGERNRGEVSPRPPFKPRKDRPHGEFRPREDQPASEFRPREQRGDRFERPNRDQGPRGERAQGNQTGGPGPSRGSQRSPGQRPGGSQQRFSPRPGGAPQWRKPGFGPKPGGSRPGGSRHRPGGGPRGRS